MGHGQSFGSCAVGVCFGDDGIHHTCFTRDDGMARRIETGQVDFCPVAI